jgi:phenylpropionate dioxygenase-like ring-hydroxylating dioxygenase large terminal subunit
MMAAPELIYDMWYVAAHGSKLPRGKTLALTMLGQQVLLGRDSDGAVFALKDFCPHRGIPLRYGSFDGKEIECCYHGWCFNTKGACTKIPSLTPDDKVDLSRIKTMSYPCREFEGNIWVYIPAPKARVPESLPELPISAGPEGKSYHLVDSVVFPCHIDHAVIGLMDPSHGPFVHTSWWWRTRRSIHFKEKAFGPIGLGFRMKSHKPSTNSRAYKILGGDRKTEIMFQLPGLRSEHITIGNRHIVLLTALTPIDEKQTVLHQFIYTSSPALNLLQRIAMPFGKAFIRQDLDIVIKQQEGLRGDHPSLMLLGGADQQALWYFKLKKDYLEAHAQGVPFENRLPEKVLRWNS